MGISPRVSDIVYANISDLLDRGARSHRGLQSPLFLEGLLNRLQKS